MPTPIIKVDFSADKGKSRESKSEILNRFSDQKVQSYENDIVNLLFQKVLDLLKETYLFSEDDVTNIYDQEGNLNVFIEDHIANCIEKLIKDPDHSLLVAGDWNAPILAVINELIGIYEDPTTKQWAEARILGIISKTIERINESKILKFNVAEARGRYEDKRAINETFKVEA